MEAAAGTGETQVVDAVRHGLGHRDGEVAGGWPEVTGRGTGEDARGERATGERALDTAAYGVQGLGRRGRRTGEVAPVQGDLHVEGDEYRPPPRCAMVPDVGGQVPAPGSRLARVTAVGRHARRLGEDAEGGIDQGCEGKELPDRVAVQAVAGQTVRFKAGPGGCAYLRGVLPLAQQPHERCAVHGGQSAGAHRVQG
ncbi:hypothetical protein [Streptomyces violaceusniger]|uniref:hypothetical protein n=1 Tax=Streptomyces violaceusniger TaxID=68280 RepID=UPI0010F9A5D6